MAYGTLSVADLQKATNQTVYDIGEDVTWRAIETDLEAHNRIFRSSLAPLIDMTTDRVRRYGGSDTISMDEVDEFARADAQKVTTGSNVGFPLRLYQASVQWTRKYFQNATGAEVAAQFIGVQDGDMRALIRNTKRAIFTPTNTTFTDRLVDLVALPVKALINADSAPIPNNPIDGTTFNAATHTHYLFTAGVSLALADFTALVNTVREHFATGELVVYINSAQEAAVRALTGFVAYTDPRIYLPGGYTTLTAGATLETFNVYDRQIGILGDAEVWVKPWVPSGYLFAYNRMAPPPLVMRERRNGSSNLAVMADDESYPLRARTMEREYGISPWTRSNGAALYIDSGAAGSYTAPTIT